MYVDSDMHSFIVWLMAGITERVMARKAMRLEGAEGNHNNFGIFCCAAHERALYGSHLS